MELQLMLETNQLYTQNTKFYLNKYDISKYSSLYHKHYNHQFYNLNKEAIQIKEKILELEILASFSFYVNFSIN